MICHGPDVDKSVDKVDNPFKRFLPLAIQNTTVNKQKKRAGKTVERYFKKCQPRSKHVSPHNLCTAETQAYEDIQKIHNYPEQDILSARTNSLYFYYDYILLINW